MSFLVLLLAVLIEKFSALRQRVQRDGPWLNQLSRLESSPRTAKRPWWILSVTVLLPCLVLALVLWVLGSVAGFQTAELIQPRAVALNTLTQRRKLFDQHR